MKKKAIEFAEKQIEDKKDTDTEMNQAMISDGWVYYCQYSSEGDNIRIVKRILDKEV